jgi:hypothetical protein
MPGNAPNVVNVADVAEEKSDDDPHWGSFDKRFYRRSTWLTSRTAPREALVVIAA